MAHYAALDELSKLNNNTHQTVLLKDEETDSVEFEISDEILDFYESSRKFKNEKKEKKRTGIQEEWKRRGRGEKRKGKKEEERTR